MTLPVLAAKDFGSLRPYSSGSLSEYLPDSRLMLIDYSTFIIPMSSKQTDNDLQQESRKRLFYIESVCFPRIQSRVTMFSVAFAYQNHKDGIIHWLMNDSRQVFDASAIACKKCNVVEGLTYVGLYALSMPISIFGTKALVEHAKAAMYEPTPAHSSIQLRNFVNEKRI